MPPKKFQISNFFKFYTVEMSTDSLNNAVLIKSFIPLKVLSTEEVQTLLLLKKIEWQPFADMEQIDGALLDSFREENELKNVWRFKSPPGKLRFWKALQAWQESGLPATEYMAILQHNEKASSTADKVATGSIAASSIAATSVAASSIAATSIAASSKKRKLTTKSECGCSKRLQLLEDNLSTLYLEQFNCPITLELMQSPVVCADGHSYEQSAIQEWLKSHNTSPATGIKLKSSIIIDNVGLKSAIVAFKALMKK